MALPPLGLGLKKQRTHQWSGCSDSQTPKSEEIQLGGVRGEPLSLRIGNPLRLESAGRWAGRRSRSPTRPLRRWRPSTFARAVVLHALGRFATWSRRGPSRRPVAGQSDGFETRAAFKRIRWHTFAGTGFIIFLARKSVSYIRSASCGCGVRFRGVFQTDGLNRELR